MTSNHHLIPISQSIINRQYSRHLFVTLQVQVEGELAQMRRELAAKDEELMTLLHSSVQSGEIAAGKLAHSNERVLAAQAELRAAHDKIAALEATDASRIGELRNLRHVLTAEIKTLTEEKSELRASCTQYVFCYTIVLPFFSCL
jgi:chromosome segregation ATPase